MKTKFMFALMIVFALLWLAGCGAVNTLTGGGKGGGTVVNLWSDVPSFQGANKVDVELPLVARIAITAAGRGKFDFIVYQTDKSTAEVQAFYSPDRMKAAGWQSSDQACVGSGDTGGSGGICSFTKQENGKDLALLIFVATDDSTKKTNIIYARVDATDIVTPTP